MYEWGWISNYVDKFHEETFFSTTITSIIIISFIIVATLIIMLSVDFTLYSVQLFWYIHHLGFHCTRVLKSPGLVLAVLANTEWVLATLILSDYLLSPTNPNTQWVVLALISTCSPQLTNHSEPLVTTDMEHNFILLPNLSNLRLWSLNSLTASVLRWLWGVSFSICSCTCICVHCYTESVA